LKIHYSQSNIRENILDVKEDKQTFCQNWGLDNCFPQLIEDLGQISVTTNFCFNKRASAIYGKGIQDTALRRMVVNKDGQSLNEVFRAAAKEVSRHNNAFIQVGYNSDLKIDSIKIIPNTDCRVGKLDSNKFNGKFLVYDNWAKNVAKKINVDAIQKIDNFSLNKEILQEQIEKAKGIRSHKGQILHVKNDTNIIYGISDLMPVLSEAVAESDSSTFRQSGISNGFLGSKLLIINPFEKDEDARDFKRNLKMHQGAENSNGLLVMETSQKTEDVSRQVHIEDLSSEYNDALLEYTDRVARKNIAISLEVPLILIDSSDSSLFGNSGELLKQARIELFNSQESNRELLTEAFEKILNNWHEPITQPFEIINPFEDEIQTTDNA